MAALSRNILVQPCTKIKIIYIHEMLSSFNHFYRALPGIYCSVEQIFAY